MKKSVLENGNTLYTGTAREVLSLWRKLTERHMDDWTFITNVPKLNMEKNYGLYIDEVDVYRDLFDRPQLGVVNASTALELLNVI